MTEQTTTTDTTNDNPPALDLDAGVTPDDYRTCLERILTAGATVAGRNSWCRDWTTYLMNINPHYHRGGVIEIPADETLNRDWFSPEGWDEYFAKFNQARAAELRSTRGRILTYVENHEVSLEDANMVLAAAGLPVYEGQQGLNGYALYFGGTTRARSTVSRLNREEYTALVREQERSFLAAVGYAAQDPSRGGFVTVEARRMPTVAASERSESLYRH